MIARLKVTKSFGYRGRTLGAGKIFQTEDESLISVAKEKNPILELLSADEKIKPVIKKAKEIKTSQGGTK